MSQPQQPRRAAAYIRESTEEQGRGYSPDGQRQAIARYTADHGMQLVEEYIDFQTGRHADKRPDFQRLIEDAMEHRFEVVLIFHTSRFARNTIEAKHYKKLLRTQLGIEVISVTQPLGANANDPAAFLSESVHEIFDEYYSVSLSFWVKMGLREKARQGLLTGSLPWGLAKGTDGIAVPDPERAPFVLRLYELYATGQHTDRTLAEWLNLQGQRTTKGRAFSTDTVREMLSTPPTAATSPPAATNPRRSKDCTGRSFPRSYSTAYSSCADSAPAPCTQAASHRDTYCADSRTAGAATHGCTARSAGAT
jgi:site-specific DNA recombinase